MTPIDTEDGRRAIEAFLQAAEREIRMEARSFPGPEGCAATRSALKALHQAARSFGLPSRSDSGP